MQYLIHIPMAILNSITLLGLGWVLYKFIENNFKLSAKSLFLIASSILLLSTLLFLLDISLLFTLFDLTWLKIQPQLFSNFQFDISNRLLFGIGVCYYIIIIFLLIKMLFQFNKLNELKAEADFSFSENYKSILHNFSNLVPSKLKIGVVDNISSPMVFGVTETIVLLPISLCNHLSTQEIKYILLHELAHVTRKDYLINIFIELSNTIMWFNPFSYLMINEIHLQREIDCDLFVTKNESNPIHYSKILLSIANFNADLKNSFTIGAIGSSKQLLQRIQKINGIENTFKQVKIRFALLFILIFSLFKFITSNLKAISPIADRKVSFINQPLVLNKVDVKSISLQKSELRNNIKPFSNKQKVNQKQNTTVSSENENIVQLDELLPNEPGVSYSDILQQTKNWIRNHQSPALFAKYNTTEINKDSIDDKVANVLLLASIVKSYQLKRALLEKQIHKTSNYNEANDYLMNSKEWEEVLQYEKWIEQFLSSHQ